MKKARIGLSIIILAWAASSAELLEEGRADLWDSEKISSYSSQNLDYGHGICRQAPRHGWASIPDSR